MTKKIFAKLLPYASRRHERLSGERKRALFAALQPDSIVVELGAGTGPNFPYYPRSIRWIGIEPNGHLSAALQEASRGFDAQVLALDAARLPIEDATADAVVCTLVLCSVADPRQVLAEAVRILKPGGRLYFLEHVGAPRGSATRMVQKLMDPFWRICADGCRTCRDTANYLTESGLENLRMEAFQLPLGPLSPHIIGTGTKRIS